VQIDGDIEAVATETARHGDVVAQPGEAGSLWHDQKLVDVRIASEHRRSRRFDKVRDVSVGEPPPKRAKKGRGEGDVADQAKANKKDSGQFPTSNFHLPTSHAPNVLEVGNWALGVFVVKAL
jgi:hypothetical protein